MVEAARTLAGAEITLVEPAPIEHAITRPRFGALLALHRPGTVRVQAVIGGKATGASVLRAEMLREYRQAFQAAGWIVHGNAFAVDVQLPLHLKLNGHTLTRIGSEERAPRLERRTPDGNLVFQCGSCRQTARLAELRATACARPSGAPMLPAGSSGPRRGETTLDRIIRLTEAVNAVPVALGRLYRVEHASHGPGPDPMVVTLHEQLPGEQVKAFAADLIALGYYTAVEIAASHHAPRLIAVAPGRRDVVDFIPLAPC